MVQPDGQVAAPGIGGMESGMFCIICKDVAASKLGKSSMAVDNGAGGGAAPSAKGKPNTGGGPAKGVEESNSKKSARRIGRLGSCSAGVSVAGWPALGSLLKGGNDAHIANIELCVGANPAGTDLGGVIAPLDGSGDSKCINVFFKGISESPGGTGLDSKPSWCIFTALACLSSSRPGVCAT